MPQPGAVEYFQWLGYLRLSKTHMDCNRGVEDWRFALGALGCARP